MILFYSGSCGLSRNLPNAEPEFIIKSGADVMLSFCLIRAGWQAQDVRFELLCKGRGMLPTGNKKAEGWEVGCISSHFLDSGSFTLWTQAAKYAEEHKAGKYAFYDTKEHWEYVDAYATFIKRYRDGIDLYANVDVIPNPELSWRNQQYLEGKHGLRPVPVVHYKTNLKWLKHYMDRGYDIIALGGLVGSTGKDGCQGWIGRAFEMVCDPRTRLPRHKLHGFGVTRYELLLDYPWFSVDSTSWTKVGAYGGILVPHKRGGEFTFMEEPYLVKVSGNSPDKKILGRHFHTMSRPEKKIVMSWLDHIGIPFGKGKEGDRKAEEFGVSNRHSERKCANLLFFEELRRQLDEVKGPYPWPFSRRRKKTFRDLINQNNK